MHSENFAWRHRLVHWLATMLITTMILSGCDISPEGVKFREHKEPTDKTQTCVDKTKNADDCQKLTQPKTPEKVE